MYATIYEKINQIDWERLGIKDVSDWLIGLMSNDKFTRLDAAQILNDNIVNLGQVTLEEPPPLSSMFESEIVLFVVPILIEMLRNEVVPNKLVVLDLVESSVSNVYWEISATDEPYRSRALQLYEIAKTGTNVYRSLLNDPDLRIRNVSREILGFLEREDFPS